jgi:hypothetical protein
MQHGAEHFLDGLWLDNADLQSVPHGSRRELAGATGLEPAALNRSILQGAVFHAAEDAPKLGALRAHLKLRVCERTAQERNRWTDGPDT